MPVQPAITWVKYFDEFADKKINTADLSLESIDSLINVHRHSFNVLHHSVPMIYLLDYTTGKYVFVSRECSTHLDFSYKKMMDGGVNFVLDNYHPADMELFNNDIFPDRLKILKSIPPGEHKDHIFSYNYRAKNGKGQYVNLLQRNSFIKSDENGRPLLSLGVVTNVKNKIFEITNTMFTGLARWY